MSKLTYKLNDLETKVYKVLFTNPILGTNPEQANYAENFRIQETKEATKKLIKIFKR